MRQLHQSLRENHHLRHGGRMQYGLFLKAIGLSLEQALQFWRSEFIKGKVDADKVTVTQPGYGHVPADQEHLQSPNKVSKMNSKKKVKEPTDLYLWREN